MGRKITCFFYKGLRFGLYPVGPFVQIPYSLHAIKIFKIPAFSVFFSHKIQRLVKLNGVGWQAFVTRMFWDENRMYFLISSRSIPSPLIKTPEVFGIPWSALLEPKDASCVHFNFSSFVASNTFLGFLTLACPLVRVGTLGTMVMLRTLDHTVISTHVWLQTSSTHPFQLSSNG